MTAIRRSLRSAARLALFAVCVLLGHPWHHALSGIAGVSALPVAGETPVYGADLADIALSLEPHEACLLCALGAQIDGPLAAPQAAGAPAKLLWIAPCGAEAPNSIFIAGNAAGRAPPALG